MNRQEYADRVLSGMRWVTAREEQSIRQELEGHIEDHMEGLLALGWDEQLAEERTLEAMGDPAEVGRALDREYPFRWLVLADLCRLVTVLTLVGLVLFGGMAVTFRDCGESLTQRYRPEAPATALTALRYDGELEDRLRLGDDELRLLSLRVGKQRRIPLVNNREILLAEVTAIIYDRMPLGISGRVELTLENERGERQNGYWESGSQWLDTYRAFVPIEEGDTGITLYCRQFGEEVSLELPISWEEAP